MTDLFRPHLRPPAQDSGEQELTHEEADLWEAGAAEFPG